MRLNDQLNDVVAHIVETRNALVLVIFAASSERDLKRVASLLVTKLISIGVLQREIATICRYLECEIVLDTGARILLRKAARPEHLKGFSPTCVLIEEEAQLTREAAMQLGRRSDAERAPRILP